LIKIFADGGYRGELIEKVKRGYGWILEIVLRSDSQKSPVFRTFLRHPLKPLIILRNIFNLGASNFILCLSERS
jgi:hypothetical protein